MGLPFSNAPTILICQVTNKSPFSSERHSLFTLCVGVLVQIQNPLVQSTSRNNLISKNLKQTGLNICHVYNSRKLKTFLNVPMKALYIVIHDVH